MIIETERKSINTWFLKLLFFLMIFEVPYYFLYLFVPLFIFLYCIIKSRFILPVGRIEIYLSVFIISFYTIDTYLGVSVRLMIFLILGYIFLFSSGRICGLRENKDFFIQIFQYISYCYLAYVIISILYSLLKGGFLYSRNPINIWTGVMRPATHYGTMLVFPLSFGLYKIILGDKDKIKGVVMLLLTFCITLVLGSRTVLYLIPIGFVIGFIFEVLVDKNLNTKHLQRLAWIVIIVVFIAMIWFLDIFNVQEMFFKTALGQRYVIGEAPTFKEDGRYSVVQFFFDNFSKCIWGGAYIRRNMYNLHNVYLNIIDLSGIIPFIAFIALNICVLKDIIFVNKTREAKDFKLLINIYFSLFFLQMLFEPVMESVPIAMVCMMFLAGFLHSYRRRI